MQNWHPPDQGKTSLWLSAAAGCRPRPSHWDSAGGGCPGVCSEPLTMLRLPQLCCLGPSCALGAPHHIQQRLGHWGTTGFSCWEQIMGLLHHSPGTGRVAFAPMSSMVHSSEKKEESWQCSKAFITFINFTSVTMKLIARYLYSPFPFPPLPTLLLRYIHPLWRALGLVSQYLT